VHFTSEDRIFACFLVSGVGKLIKAGLSYCRCQRHHTTNKFIGSVVDTAEQLVSGVVDTGEKFYVFWLFLTGINDTGEKCYRRCQRHRR
jgi:hypothetical protein